jgi:hypothetical protein
MAGVVHVQLSDKLPAPPAVARSRTFVVLDNSKTQLSSPLERWAQKTEAVTDVNRTQKSIVKLPVPPPSRKHA